LVLVLPRRIEDDPGTPRYEDEEDELEAEEGDSEASNGTPPWKRGQPPKAGFKHYEVVRNKVGGCSAVRSARAARV